MNVWKVASLSVCLGLAPAAAWGADGPQFEAASVKVAPADARPPYTISGGPGTDDPGRFHASHINMVTLLTQAFGVSVDQITVPARLKDSTQSAYYAVDLAIPPGTTKEQYQKMMQNLLTDRFHLAYHRETRDFPGYELVVDKDGPKFKEVAPTPGAEPNPTMRIIMGGTLPAEFPELDGPQTISMSGGGITRT